MRQGTRGVRAATETTLGHMGPHHRDSETPPEGAARGCFSPGLVSSSSLPLHRWHHDKVPLVLQRLHSNATPSGAFWKGARLNGKRLFLNAVELSPSFATCSLCDLGVGVKHCESQFPFFFVNLIGTLWRLKSEHAQHNFDHVWNVLYMLELKHLPESSMVNCSSLCVPMKSFPYWVTCHTVVW